MPETAVTQALIDLSRGDRAALDRLLPAVYDHLHRLAERELRRERGDHTLSPTALVHEAYLKLVQLEDRKSTRLNSSHHTTSRMPSSA